MKVTNPSVPDTSDIADDALEGFDAWDEVIDNCGTLKELYVRVGMMKEKYFV